ncbi:MAG: WG repeat-containing protein [Propionibacteriaceae bacterium]|nr:WG repeat-containing protein [Propionibacteriaceae bacterium]
MLRRFLPAVTLVVAALLVATPAEAVPPDLPAADGQPMLWPAPTAVAEVDEGGRPSSVTRYGFVDTAGELVVPAAYSSYSYCADADGRPAVVLASGTEGSDLIAFTGQVVAQVDTPYAACVGTGYLVVTRPSAGRVEVGVVEAATGESVLAPAGHRKVTAVTSSVVNVSRPAGEYFLDLTTGATTSHPGWVTVAAMESGAPGIPAAARRTSSGKLTGKFGYLGRTGRWLVSPEFDAASAFRDGYAVVEQNGRATFLDAGFRRVGGEWDRIRPVTIPAAIGERVLGYWVEADGRRGLLGPDLETVVQPGPGQIDCEPTASGACAVVAPDGLADLVQLPQGGATTLPGGFTRVLTAGLVADRPSVDQPAATRIRSLATARTITLPGSASCRGVGRLFVTCSGSLVIDSDGDQTEFTSAVAIPDPAGGAAYYWVTTDSEQGFLDSDGRWRYRQAR